MAHIQAPRETYRSTAEWIVRAQRGQTSSPSRLFPDVLKMTAIYVFPFLPVFLPLLKIKKELEKLECTAAKEKRVRLKRRVEREREREKERERERERERN